MWPAWASCEQRMIRSTRPKWGRHHSPARKSVALVVYRKARNGARRQRHTPKRRQLTKPYRLTQKHFLISSDSPRIFLHSHFIKSDADFRSKLTGCFAEIY